MKTGEPVARRRRARPKVLQKIDALRRVIKRLSPYLRGRKRDLALALLSTVGFMLLRLLEPWPIKIVLDNVLLGKPLPESLSFVGDWTGGRTGLLNLVVVAIVVIAVLSGFFYYWQNVLSAYVGQKVVARLRADLFRHLQHLDFSFHDRRKTGDLLVRLTADIRLLRDALVKIPLGLSENSLLMVGMAIIMLLMDWRLALVSFASLPLLYLLMRRYRKPMRAAIRKQRRQEGDLATKMSESLGAIRVVHGFGLEEQEAERVGRFDNRSLREGLKAARIEARLRWASELAVGAITAVVVGVAARRIMSGALSPGDLVVFVSYLRTFARPLRRASRTTEQVTRTATAGERILEVLDLVPGVRDLPDANEAPAFVGEVSFEKVGLRHGRGPWVLRTVNLTVRPGERLGIVGPTGAGKSSLVSLVPRFYDATEGRVCIDGRDVRSFTLVSLRRQVSFVFQEPVLFATTIAENIAAGRPGADREAIVEAARSAGIHDVIAALPEGYDTIPGERGGTLSGGQRQCVAIARAMLRDAPIVVLDEPTAGLDQRAASIVTDALQKLMQGRTVLMISHDLDRLRDADRIVVLENGRLVQEGGYAEMSLRAGLFRELVEFGQVR
ncbi:MAG TPA: ABC transporter ATP-binding protein [Gemmatimonadaceae bacterium]|nr:ABC transporter ATP-binding protein [Gemmatimonadaceae bacterium]